MAESSPDPIMWVQRGRVRKKQATVSQSVLLRWGREQLAAVGAGPMEAVWLLEWAMGVPSLITGPDQVGIRAAEKYRSAISQRKVGTPLQHITGEMAFRGLTLNAGPGVFSVRPETENLVDVAFAALQGRDDSPESFGGEHSTPLENEPPGESPNMTVVDLCAGSGALGLAIASERAGTDVTLVELERTAVSYLKRNASTIPIAEGSTVSVRIEDAMEALPGREGTIDLVVSNPPYVSHTDAPEQVEANHDPLVALFGGGEDGLVTPRGIVGRAFNLLGRGGVLVMEHGETQGSALREHAQNVGFTEVSTHQDLVGRDRYLVARKS